MSQAAVDVEVRLKMQDGASAGIKAVAQAAEQAADKAATATERAAQKAADATEQSASRQRSSYERLSHARETLGMRGEQAIQREIDKTVAAYNRLAQGGKLSFGEQTRAAEAMRSKVEQLTNEMGKLTTQQKIMAGIKTTAAIGAGVAAAGYVLRDPAKAAMSFDDRMAAMANTAYAERDVAGRKIGMAQLEATINRSVGKGGGGSRDQAAEALDMLIASGAMGINDAMAMLPALMRASAATSTNALQLAQIGVRGMQTFKVAPDQFMNLLNMALVGGQAGGFELKDMAQWLPQQMAAASQSGMSGRAGFGKLVALNQAAAITAGDNQEAGNNVVNLLAKINSDQVASAAKDELGLDLGKHLQAYRARGLDGIDAFAALVDQSVAKNSNYQALQEKLAGAKTDTDKRATLESMAAIAQGTGIGKIIADRQATMALIGMLNNREYMNEVLAKVRAADVTKGGAVETNYGVVSSTAGFKLQQAEQQKDIGQKAAMDSLTPAIGKVSELFGDMVAKYPLLSGATITATSAIGAFAAAAGGAALVLGGGKIPGVAGGAIDRASRAAKSPLGVKAGKVALVAGAGIVGWEIGKRIAESTDSGGRLWELFNGDKQRAQKAATSDLDRLRAVNQAAAAKRAAAAMKPSGQETKTTATINLGLAPGLVVTGQHMQTSGPGTVRMNTGNIHTGAP